MGYPAWSVGLGEEAAAGEYEGAGEETSEGGPFGFGDSRDGGRDVGVENYAAGDGAAEGAAVGEADVALGAVGSGWKIGTDGSGTSKPVAIADKDAVFQQRDCVRSAAGLDEEKIHIDVRCEWIEVEVIAAAG